jgi:N-alpha-acetyltransferase 35, NatC auxiliary subunit
VHVDDFNLFDSMSALELMDPKMDAGLALHGAAPLTVQDRVARGAVPLAFPSARDVLATVDAIFRVEAAWLHGQPLPQTLLTCVYMHREAVAALLTQLLPSAEEVRDGETVKKRLQKLGGAPQNTLLLVMATVSVFTLRTCVHVRELVVRADMYEEEDFSPGNTGQLDASFESVGWPRAALDELLAFAIDRLETLLAQERALVAAKGSSKKAHKKKGSKAKDVTAKATDPVATGDAGTTSSPLKLEGLDANIKISAQVSEALLRRLQLRRTLHGVYSHVGFADELVDLTVAQEQFSAAQVLLAQIKAETLELDGECFSGKPLGFDKTLSRLLAAGSPPRDVQPTTMEQAVVIYDALMRDLLVACSPADGSWQRMEDVRVFLADFSRRRPNIIARSFVLVRVVCGYETAGNLIRVWVWLLSSCCTVRRRSTAATASWTG